MIKYNKIYDISVILGEESIDYPGDPEFSREFVSSIDNGGNCNLSKLEMSAHSGTHIDLPYHFISNKKSIEQYPIESFILPAQVIEIKDPKSIKVAELEKVKINKETALILKTKNSLSGICKNGTFSENYVYLTPEAAEYCVEKQISLVGIDYISIEKYAEKRAFAHHKILGNNILILEGVNLKEVPIGLYTLFCLPLKINGGEGSPVRAILIE